MEMKCDRGGETEDCSRPGAGVICRRRRQWNRYQLSSAQLVPRNTCYRFPFLVSGSPNFSILAPPLYSFPTLSFFVTLPRACRNRSPSHHIPSGLQPPCNPSCVPLGAIVSSSYPFGNSKDDPFSIAPYIDCHLCDGAEGL